MPLVPEQQLRKNTYTECDQQLTKLVTKAKLRIEPQDSSVKWDPYLHRHLFEESFTIWREFDDIEMTVGPGGDILAFHDANRFTLGGPPPVGLPEDSEIIPIASTTGLIGPKVSIEQKGFSSAGIVDAVIRQNIPWFNQSIRFLINMTTRQVAAFKVVEGKKV